MSWLHNDQAHISLACLPNYQGSAVDHSVPWLLPKKSQPRQLTIVELFEMLRNRLQNEVL